jgi:integrase/recombinase XerD
MRVIQRWFVWLVRKGHLGANPAVDLDHPRLTRHLPDVLTADEVALVLAQCDLTTPDGVRDRAFLELVCATGLRRTEAARLDERDLDETQGVILVREGKGRKDRYVPVSVRAFAWLARYRQEVRSVWCRCARESRLFLRPDGEPAGEGMMSGRVHRLLAQAGITKRGACHLFRHTFATGLMEQGCDIRLIGAMLGHHQLSSTALYTHVTVGPLVRAHARFHQLPEAAAKKEAEPADPVVPEDPPAFLPVT